MIEPITLGLVGGGWRAEFYFRIARALPDRFRIAGCFARSEATRARILTDWGIPVFQTLDELLDQHLDFVVTSVPWLESPLPPSPDSRGPWRNQQP